MRTLLSHLLGVVTVFLHITASSQTTQADNFQIGNFLEVFNRDSIKIYFSCNGSIADKRCASYYRIGKIDPINVNVTGAFYDYDIKGNLVLKASMLNNGLHGDAEYYYWNGQLKEKGRYANNVRQGRWTFYHPNGQVEKVYYYSVGEPLVLEAYTSSGKTVVTNGKGHFKTEFSKDLQCDYFIASGSLLNGKKDGEWKFSIRTSPVAISTEIFKEGKFVSGKSDYTQYTDNPRISFFLFSAHENLNLVEKNGFGCGTRGVFLAHYNNKVLGSEFYPLLQKKLSDYNNPKKDQWLIAGIKLDKKNKIIEVNVASSINDMQLENFIHEQLSKMTKWKTAVVDGAKIESNIYFCILVDKNQLLIPANIVFLSENF